MHSKIKKILNSNLLLKDISYLIFATRKNEYRELLDAYISSSNVLWFHELGDNNPNNKYYYISIGENDNDDACSTGFFALIMKYGLKRLDFADRMNLIPYIFWGDNTLYYDKKVKETDNAFEYYFKQIADESKNEILNSKYVCFSKPNHILTGKMAYGNSLYADTNNGIDRYAFLFKKYFKLNNKTEEYLEKNIKGILKSDEVLGVHYRGVDWQNLKNHPIPGTIKEFFEEIDKALTSHDFKYIFLATESEETLEQFKNKYKDMLLYYADVNRTSVGSTDLVIFDEKKDKYILGLEVLRDAYTLSSCSGFIGGISQVSLATRYIKKSKDEQFDYEKIIDKGIRDNGISINNYIKDK